MVTSGVSKKNSKKSYEAEITSELRKRYIRSLKTLYPNFENVISELSKRYIRTLKRYIRTLETLYANFENVYPIKI